MLKFILHTRLTIVIHNIQGYILSTCRPNPFPKTKNILQKSSTAKQSSSSSSLLLLPSRRTPNRVSYALGRLASCIGNPVGSLSYEVSRAVGGLSYDVAGSIDGLPHGACHATEQSALTLCLVTARESVVERVG